jgi:CRISPR/Cas system-associated exonuclease Cas4 (RecB family)
MSGIALSWSRVNDFRTCPFKFKEKYITKSYPDESNNPAFAKGTEVHKQLEEYVKAKKKGIDKPTGFIAKAGLPIVDRIMSMPGEAFPELQLAITPDWSKVAWFSKDIKYRAIIDLLHVHGDQALIVDYKTGKASPYTEARGQLHLSTAIVFELYPEVNTITSALLFLEHKQTNKYLFVREMHAANKAAWDLEHAAINEEVEFAPKKNKYCYFCLSTTCPLK